MLSLLSTFLIIGSVVVNAVPNEGFNASLKNRDYFLPDTSVPNHYDLHLNVELGPNYEYNGTVNIDLSVLKSVRKLVLHSHDLKIDLKNSFLLKNGELKKRFDITAAVENSTNRFLNVWFKKQITPGNYTLRLAFKGHYYTYANGLFLSSYKDENGKEKYLLATHFEPVRARDMFPCYDEPNLKTTFKVTVTHPRNYSAVSNMPVESIRTDGNTKTTTFQNTPKMSTYLLAIGVSDYETLQGHFDGQNYSIHVQPGKLNAVSFSLNVTLNCIKQYHKLLKVKYSLPKLDGIVVPTFGGGMENWGLIVYGTTIVANNSTSEPMPPNKLRSMVNLIVHEVAHQWFGNLVTLDWWDYVWLNEGFATYYASRVSDMIYPEQRFMDRQVLSLLYVLKAESQLQFAQSINRPVVKLEDIMQKFDTISYNKGSAIVRFMQMTFDDYDQAISDYLQKNSYDNTEPLDLFESINNRARLRGNLTVQGVMKSWSSNSGYPLLTVDVAKYRNISTVSFSQTKFSLEKNNSTDKWWIPITLATESNPNFNNLTVLNWLSDKENSFLMSFNTRNNGWIIANLQKAAYMRVNYDVENWKRIVAYLKGPYYTKIHYLNRIQLIDDSTALVHANLLPENINLDLLTYLKQERDELVLSAAKILFKEYLELLRGTEAFNKFQIFVVDIFGFERGGNLLKPSSLEDLLNKAISNEDSRHFSLLESFKEIGMNLYTSESLLRVRNAIVQNRNSSVQKQMEFLEKVNELFEANKALKERFLKYNYENVKRWLDSRY